MPQAWLQNYDPAGNIWLSALVALIPIIFFFLALTKLRLKGYIAGTITVFDSNTLGRLDSISLPSHPNSLALDTRNNVHYATIKNGEKDPQGSAESVVRIAF